MAERPPSPPPTGPTGDRRSSAADAAGAAGATNRRQHLHRNRADSAGSTRGAFNQGFEVGGGGIGGVSASPGPQGQISDDALRQWRRGDGGGNDPPVEIAVGSPRHGGGHHHDHKKKRKPRNKHGQSLPPTAPAPKVGGGDFNLADVASTAMGMEGVGGVGDHTLLYPGSNEARVSSTRGGNVFADASAHKTHPRDPLMYSDQGSLHYNSGDLLLESLENDIEQVNGHGNANESRLTRSYQNVPSKPPRGDLASQRKKSLVNPNLKKNIPRPSPAVRTSSFGPSAGLPGVMQAQENDIRNFSSMALQDGSGHGRTPNSASGLRDDGYGATVVEQGSREAYGAKVDKIAKAREARDEPKPEPFVHKSIPPGGLNGIEVEGETVTHTVWESILLKVWGPTPPPPKAYDMEDEGSMANSSAEGSYWEPDIESLPPLRRLFHYLFYNPYSPEFTSTQQFSWAIVLGIFFGFLTAYWGMVIDWCVEFVWETVPEVLLEWGWFTDLEGPRPLPHYFWVCPTVFGAILAWVSVMIPKPIPDQNEWIITLHQYGVLDHDTFFNLIIISTLGMASGLSLGPELPLILTAGMVGSYLGLLTHQSILSARVMNLTAGSAAIGGFFGFPMAGALFVLELPHQMGLQYFEALSPATIASIFSVLVNRIVTKDDLKGYFNYPWLASSLPSKIFYIAILYGLVGSVIGIIYADGVKKIKTWVHDLFHYHEHHDEHHEDHHDGPPDTKGGETVPLVGKAGLVIQPPKEKDHMQKTTAFFHNITHFTIKNEPLRAAIVGALGGAATGLICMFLPHNLFWGEAQLQTLIDNGWTPLPVFGQGDEPTAALTGYGICMIDPEDDDARRQGFSISCMGLIALTKILTIGISIGTGIIGGHFWGPLFVATAGAQAFIMTMVLFTEKFGVGGDLVAYPCVAILCIMAAAHVVTFRAHMAIILILTLTIGAFTDNVVIGGNEITKDSGGDYAAVFPLLVVSCFVSLMVSRGRIFYKQQRCRGDIVASPEALCEPKNAGIVDEYSDEGSKNDDTYIIGQTSESFLEERARGQPQNQSDVERDFDEGKKLMIGTGTPGKDAKKQPYGQGFNYSRFDELLGTIETPEVTPQSRHRRIVSASDAIRTIKSSQSFSLGSADTQQNLLQQARDHLPTRPSSSRTHSRKNSRLSNSGSDFRLPRGDSAGALFPEDLERSFIISVNQSNMEGGGTQLRR